MNPTVFGSLCDAIEMEPPVYFKVFQWDQDNPLM